MRSTRMINTSAHPGRPFHYLTTQAHNGTEAREEIKDDYNTLGNIPLGEEILQFEEVG